jgi:hypothetical protein
MKRKTFHEKRTRKGAEMFLPSFAVQSGAERRETFDLKMFALECGTEKERMKVSFITPAADEGRNKSDCYENCVRSSRKETYVSGFCSLLLSLLLEVCVCLMC